MPPAPKQLTQKDTVEQLPSPAFTASLTSAQMLSPPSSNGALPAPVGLASAPSKPALTNPRSAQVLASQHLREATQVLESVQAAKQRIQAKTRSIARDRLAMAQTEAAHNSAALQEMFDAKRSMQAALERAETARKAAVVEAAQRRRELQLAAAAASAAHEEAILTHDEENQKALQDIVAKHDAVQAQLSEIEVAIREQEEAALEQAASLTHERGKDRTLCSSPTSNSMPYGTTAAANGPHCSKSPNGSPLPISSRQSAGLIFGSVPTRTDDITRHALRIAALQEAIELLQQGADFEVDGPLFVTLRSELKLHRSALTHLRQGITGPPMTSSSPVDTATATVTSSLAPFRLQPQAVMSVNSSNVAQVAPTPVNHAERLLERLQAYEKQMQVQATQLQQMQHDMNNSPKAVTRQSPPRSTSAATIQTTVAPSNDHGEFSAGLPTHRPLDQLSKKQKGLSFRQSSPQSTTDSSESSSLESRLSEFDGPLSYYDPGSAKQQQAPGSLFATPSKSVLATLGIERKLSVQLSEDVRRQLHSYVGDTQPKFFSVRENRPSIHPHEKRSEKGFLLPSGSPSLFAQARDGMEIERHGRMFPMLSQKDCASTISMVMQGTVHRRVHSLLKQIGRKQTTCEAHILKLLRQTAQHFTSMNRTKQMVRGSVALAHELAEVGQCEKSQQLMESVDKTRANVAHVMGTVVEIKEAVDHHFINMLQQRSGAEDEVIQAEAELHSLLNAVAHAFFAHARRSQFRAPNTTRELLRSKQSMKLFAPKDKTHAEARFATSRHPLQIGTRESSKPSSEDHSLTLADDQERSQLEADIIALADNY
jgi:hypothetical protein